MQKKESAFQSPVAFSPPFLLQGTARQHLVIDHFYIGRLYRRDIDLAITYRYDLICFLRWADPDREDQWSFTGGSHAQVGRAGANILFHFGSDLEGIGLGSH